MPPGYSTRPAATVDDLTWRQREIGRLVAAGRPTREIAAEVGIAQSTVKTVIDALFDRTGTRNRVELARWYWEREG